ncbi:MAG: hypothetical protein HYZ31_11110 [Gammaproteobacteria bacterium]|jgi:hypothetical protein|nr:hypothetical protein [Gammaproteobacteria bacterium]
MWKYLVAWFVMLLVSITNGAIRDFTYGQYVDELTAHQLSSLSGIIVLGIIIWIFVKRFPLFSAQQAISIGLMWLTLTIAFEFLFFHYIGGHSWSALLANYNIFNGRIWVLVLIWIAIAPYLFFRFTPKI